jgi:peptidoglycan/LPS O-acetylase OafA/YrhL
LAGSAWLRSVLPPPSDQKFYFVFLNNWWLLLDGKSHANIIGHFWSLAVEEQFYLMWSVCVWLVPPRRLWKFCVVTFFALFVLRLGILSLSGPSQHLLENTFMRMDTLLAGSACAILVRHGDLLAKIEPWLGILAGASFIGMEAILVRAGEIFRASVYTESIGFSLIAVGYSTLVLYAYRGRNPLSILQRALRSKFLTRFGKYSYGIYVYHVPVLMIADAVLRPAFPAIFRSPWTALLYVFAVVGVSFLIAQISYEFFERRFLAYKNRFEPRYTPDPETIRIGERASAAAEL